MYYAREFVEPDYGCDFDSDYMPLKDYQSAQEWAKEVANHLYVTGDVDGLCFAIEELCHALNVKMPEGEVKVTSARSDFFNFALTLSKSLK